MLLQLLDNMESKMKGTCVEGTIPRLFEGKMIVCTYQNRSIDIFYRDFLSNVSLFLVVYKVQTCRLCLLEDRTVL